MSITDLAVANNKNGVCATFTPDQQSAYKELIEFINTPFNEKDYKRALSGAAGTGKTFLVKSLINNCRLSYHAIGLSAPTHKACRVLQESIGVGNVNTLQSDLGLKVNFDVEKFDINNVPFDPKGRVKITDYSLYIVDEASMINRGLLTYLEKICKQNECKIIYIGDASQLAPVGELYSPAFRNIKMSKLSQIVRQGDDNPVSYLLELLRYDIAHKTFKFLEYICKNPCNFNDANTKGYKLCNSAEFEQTVYSYFSNEEITRNVDYAKVIAYTNNNVSAWNKYIRNAIVKDSEKSILTKHDLVISYDTIVNDFNECVITNSEEYIIKDIVDYTEPKYGLKGFMVKFIAIHGGSVTTPLFILDHNDRFSLQMYAKVVHELIETAKNAPANSRSTRWKEYFEFKQKVLSLLNINFNNGVNIKRNIDYGFALTSHKSQGSTFDSVLVDVNDIVYDKNGHIYDNIEEINRRLYVACSRCKNKLYLKYC